MKANLALSAVFVGSWLGGCLFAGLLSPVFFVVAVYSVPFAAVALILINLFWRPVIQRPVWWALAAVAVGLAVGIVLVGRAGLLSCLVTIPSAVMFVVLLTKVRERWW